MSLRLSRRKGFTVAALSLFLVIVSEGCSQQGEGERCVRSVGGDKDCDDGLQCTAASSLLTGADNTDRCCPATPNPIHDSRCTRGNPIVHGSGGRTGSGGNSGGGASVSGGTNSAGGTTTTAEGGSTESSSGGTTSSAEGGSSDNSTPSTGGAT